MELLLLCLSFFQLYGVHAPIRGDVISCLCCLLPNNTTETYERLFVNLKALISNTQPATVMVDYGKTAMYSVAECHTGIDVQVCSYHFSQSTNNNVKRLHRKMQAAITADHPNLWRFLAILQRQQSFLNVTIFQQLRGKLVEPTRKRYRDCNSQIMNIVNDFAFRDHLEYFRGITYNIQL